MAITAYTTSFTPKCGAAGAVSSSGVTTAATAYDWFSLSSGTLSTYVSSMSTSTLAGLKNKAFVQSIAQDARAALLPLVKAESFVAKFTATATLITNEVTNIISTLTSIQDSNLLTLISTLTPSYSASLNTINTSLNSLKSFEAKVFTTSDSIDSTAAATLTSFAATPTLGSFNGVKTYLATILDPATLAASTIPAITSVNNNIGNAATLSTLFSTASTELSSSTALANYKALVKMSANTIFDHYCACIEGYTSSATTGTWASGSAPAGVVPGIDFEVHLTGNYQTGTASAGNPGAPSATTNFW